MFAGGMARAQGRSKRQTAARAEVDERPACAFGLVLGRSVEDLGKDFERLEAKINGLLIGVAVTVLVELYRSWR